MNKINYFSLLLAVLFLAIACRVEDDGPVDIVMIDETPYVMEYGGFPVPNLPEDNMFTVQGVKLRRMLFYATMLSNDDSQSCATCPR